MAIDRITEAGAAAVPEGRGDAATIRALAQQFESMLLSEMLRGMRESLAEESEGGGFGGSMMADQFSAELGLALSRAGGMGLSSYLINAFTPPAEAVANEPPPVMAIEPPSMPALPLPPTTSAYGWRADPINGQTRFHAGQDLKLAYGQDVYSAAPGVVTSVSERGGYGLLVTIDHGGGIETRYAHLSSADVAPGMEVAAGQLIARSGNSGRTTGPHLHFEVRQDGRPVDPGTVEGLISPAAGEVATR